MTKDDFKFLLILVVLARAFLMVMGDGDDPSKASRDLDFEGTNADDDHALATSEDLGAERK